MAVAEDELKIVRLRNEFYRDGFNTILLALSLIGLAIVLLCTVSVYLFLQKPAPVTFATDNEWRVVPPVPVNQPYLINADLMQWVSDAIPKFFTFDFVGYKDQVDNLKQYFTDSGWKRFTNQINVYANDNTVHNSRMFMSGAAKGAPVIVSDGLLPDGSYGWWVQMPIKVAYNIGGKLSENTFAIKVLVVRVSTLNNLSGVLIDNIEVLKNEGGVAPTNG